MRYLKRGAQSYKLTKTKAGVRVINFKRRVRVNEMYLKGEATRTNASLASKPRLLVCMVAGITVTAVRRFVRFAKSRARASGHSLFAVRAPARICCRETKRKTSRLGLI